MDKAFQNSPLAMHVFNTYIDPQPESVGLHSDDPAAEMRHTHKQKQAEANTNPPQHIRTPSTVTQVGHLSLFLYTFIRFPL